MARHSSFENLVALETCQNFFLIAGLSTGFPSNESGSEHVSVSTNHADQPEGTIHGDLPRQEIKGTIANSVETDAMRQLEE